MPAPTISLGTTGTDPKVATKEDLEDAINTAFEAQQAELDAKAAADDQTGAQIKLRYEAEGNTNAFTDAEQTKLGTLRTDGQIFDLGVAGGTTDAMTATREAEHQSVDWTARMAIAIRVPSGDNTGAVTIAVDGGTAVPLYRSDGQDLESGDLSSNARIMALVTSVTSAYPDSFRIVGLVGSQITKSHVGLGNADNTADVDKPVSTAQQDALDQLDTAIDQSFSGQFRPGEFPGQYTDNATGASGDAPGASIVVDTGLVRRVDGSATLGLLQPIGIDPQAIYAVNWAASRSTDPSDPSGDAVQFGIRWLDKDKVEIGQYTDSLGLLVSDGYWGETLSIGADAATGGVDYAWPSSAAYFVPFVRTFGTDGVTDVEVIGWGYTQASAAQNVVLSVASGPDAIVATADRTISTDAYAERYIMPVSASNTGAVTVQIDGGVAYPLITNAGEALQEDYLPAGSVAEFMFDGIQYRLTAGVSDAAIEAAAAASAAAAQQSAADAEADQVATAADRAAASASASLSLAASRAAGNVIPYDTKAAADAALSGLSEDQVVEVLVDESLGGLRTRYRVESAAYVFKLAFTPGGFEFADAQAFRDDEALTYANGLASEGDKIVIRKEGATYEIAAPSAADYHEASTGGLLAYVRSWRNVSGVNPRGRSTTPAVVDTAWLTHWNSNWPDVPSAEIPDAEWVVTGTAGSNVLTYVSGRPIADIQPANSQAQAPVAMISDDEWQMFTGLVTGQNGTNQIYLREPLEKDFSGVVTAWGDAANGQHLTQNAYRVWAKAIADATEFECARGPSYGLMHSLSFRSASQWEPNALYSVAGSNDGGTFPDRVDKHPFDTYTSSSPFLAGNMYQNGSGGYYAKARAVVAGHRNIGMWAAGHGVTFRANCRGQDGFLEGWVSGNHPTRDLRPGGAYVDGVEIEVKITQDGKVIYQKSQDHNLMSHRIKLRRAGDVQIDITLKGATSVNVYLGDWSLREAGQGGALIRPGDRVLVGMDSWGAYFSESVANGSGTLLRRGQVARELENQTGCHCIDKSEGGKTGAWVLHWLETWIQRYQPDIFITDMAVNDNTLGSTWTTTDTPDGSELPLHVGSGFVEESKNNSLGNILPSVIDDNLQEMADICAKYGVRMIYTRAGSVPASTQTQTLALTAVEQDYRAVMADGVPAPAADLENAHSVLNFRGGKYAGQRVWNRDAAAVYVASGPDPLDPWFQQDAPGTAVTPVDYFAPTFLSRNAQSVESGTDLTFAMRCDEPVTYTITGGADSGLFSLGDEMDPATRRLELPGQVAGSYVVEVTATDMGGNTSAQTITVTASD